MKKKYQNDIRCAICRGEFVSAELKEIKATVCPICGTAVKPLKISQDGYIKINWQDIRVLAIYAQRWAATFKIQNNKGNADAVKALMNIVENLENYRPKDGGPLDPNYEVVKEKETGIPSPYPFI